MNNYATDIDACRSRQQRLIDQMQQRQIDVVIVTQTEHVQWLAGPRFPWVMQAAAALRVDGHLTLAAPQKPILEAAADELVTYEAQWHLTLRNDQRQVCMELLAGSIGKQAGIGRLGVEFSSCGRHGDFGAKEVVDIEPTLYRLRRRKDADELARIRKAIVGTEKRCIGGKRNHATGDHRDRNVQSVAGCGRRRVWRDAHRDWQRLPVRVAWRSTAQWSSGCSRRTLYSRSRPGISRLLRGQLPDNCRDRSE